MSNFNSVEKSVLRLLDKWEKEKRKNMKDKVTAYIRTYTPILAGSLISWLATLGLVLDAGVQSAIVIALTTIIQGLYYALARLVGKKYPAVEKWLLGSSKQPTYKE